MKTYIIMTKIGILENECIVQKKTGFRDLLLCREYCVSMGKLRSYINKTFVENNQTLVDAMLNTNKIQGRRNSAAARACLVLRLYFKYVMLHKSVIGERQKRNSKALYPESRVNQKTEIENILSKIKEHECITFDMWGVLFYETLDRQQLLALAEVRNYRIGFSDLQAGGNVLSPDQIDHMESIIEDFAMQNPVMCNLVDEVIRQGKDVYICNNSDYPDRLIQNILKPFSHNMSLGRKGLHISNKDLDRNDMEYKNVNILGDAYRPFCYLNAVTSLYNQVVNIQFHSQGKEYPLFYEYGFSYGGILTCGFCQFLDRLAGQEKIDKFLFVARDGDIMEKVYKKYFDAVDTAYLVFSRFASYELIFGDFPEEYIDKNIKPRMVREGTDNSIRRILQECGLEFLEKNLSEEGLSGSEILRKENFERLKTFILNHKSEIQNSFEMTCRAAEKYIMKEIDGAGKVCVVDLGWHGKSIVYLKHLCEKKYGWNGIILGAMIGASDNSTVQDYIRTGLMHVYAFENEYWRSMGEKAGRYMGYKECICLEALFSSESETLIRYTFDDEGNVAFVYGKKNRNKDIVAQIHKGILDFAERFMPLIQKYALRITDRDAYTPIDAVMRNQKYQDKIYHSYYEEPNAMSGF